VIYDAARRSPRSLSANRITLSSIGAVIYDAARRSPQRQRVGQQLEALGAVIYDAARRSPPLVELAQGSK